MPNVEMVPVPVTIYFAAGRMLAPRFIELSGSMGDYGNPLLAIEAAVGAVIDPTSDPMRVGKQIANMAGYDSSGVDVIEVGLGTVDDGLAQVLARLKRAEIAARGNGDNGAWHVREEVHRILENYNMEGEDDEQDADEARNR